RDRCSSAGALRRPAVAALGGKRTGSAGRRWCVASSWRASPWSHSRWCDRSGNGAWGSARPPASRRDDARPEPVWRIKAAPLTDVRGSDTLIPRWSISLRDDAICEQPRDLVLAEVGFEEDFAGVLGEHRSWARDGRGCDGHVDYRADHALRPGDGVDEFGDHAGGLHLGVVSHLFGEVDDAGRDATGEERFDPFGGGALEEALLDVCAPGFDATEVFGVGGVEPGAIGLVGHTEDGADGVAVLLRERAEDERTLGGVVAAVVEPVGGETRALGLAQRGDLVVARA